MRSWWRTLLLLGLAAVPLSASPGPGGSDVGSAGDVVECTAVAGAPLYALDYLMTSSGDDRDLPRAKSWEESRERILQGLEKYRDLQRSFLEFLKYVDNRTPHADYRLSRIWEGSPTALIYLDDQKLTRALSPWCVKAREDGTVPIHQVVTREPKPNLRAIYYEYDEALYERLRKEAPLQFSFLMVHEWLRDLTADVSVIRRANRFLHSQALERYTGEDLRLALQHMGLSLRTAEFKPICERSPEVRRAIEEIHHLPCEAISEDTLRPFSMLVVNKRGIRSLENGDFSGLGRLQELHLEDNALDYLPEDIFAGLFSLRVVNVSGNRLEELPARLFADSPRMRILNVGGNRLKALPEGLFSRVEQSMEADAINLIVRGNPLVRFPADLFSHRFGLVDARETALSEREKAALREMPSSTLWHLEL